MSPMKNVPYSFYQLFLVMKFVDNIEDTQDSNEFKHYSVHEEFKNLARQKNATGQNLVMVLCLSNFFFSFFFTHPLLY